MMTSLFDKEYKYTKEAVSIYNEASEIMAYLVKRYTSRGYSPREIKVLIESALGDAVSEHLFTIWGPHG